MDHTTRHLHISEHLTEAEFIALVEAFGGTRLYLPAVMRESHRIARAIGFNAAKNLSKALGYGAIRIPLAHDRRALFYRTKGYSKAQIARRLGMTENGVGVLLSRLDREAIKSP